MGIQLGAGGGAFLGSLAPSASRFPYLSLHPAFLISLFFAPGMLWVGI